MVWVQTLAIQMEEEETRPNRPRSMIFVESNDLGAIPCAEEEKKRKTEYWVLLY